MRTYLLIILSTFLWSSAYAQDVDTKKRWLFEAPTYLLLPSLERGEEYTQAQVSFGAAVRTLYQLPVGKRIRLAGGVGFNMQQVVQRSELDQVLCGETGGPNCDAGVLHTEAYVVNFALEVPLQLRLMLGKEGRGLYLFGRAAPQLPLFHLGDVYTVRVGDKEDSTDKGEYEGRITTMLSGGMGYQLRATDGLDVYVQADVGRSTGTVNEDLGTGTAASPNYLQPTRLWQVGFSFGVSF
jgi:hypothetical protein